MSIVISNVAWVSRFEAMGLDNDIELEAAINRNGDTLVTTVKNRFDTRTGLDVTLNLEMLLKYVAEAQADGRLLTIDISGLRRAQREALRSSVPARPPRVINPLANVAQQVITFDGPTENLDGNRTRVLIFRNNVERHIYAKWHDVTVNRSIPFADLGEILGSDKFYIGVLDEGNMLSWLVQIQRP